MDKKKDVVKVFLHKSAKSIDLKSLREILDKARDKQKSESSIKIVKRHDDPVLCQYVSPEKIQISKRDVAKKESKNPSPKAVPDQPMIVDDFQENITSQSQNDHQSTDASNKTEYSCCFCEYTTKGDGEYRKHISSHIKNRALRCNLCPFSADKISAYNIHMMEAHRKETPAKLSYVCAVCSFSCTYINDFLKHKTITGHRGIQQKDCTTYKCKLCGLRNPNVLRLAMHILTHTRESPQCSLCKGDSVGKKTHDPDCFEIVAPMAYKFEETIEQTQKGRFTCTLCDFGSEELLFLIEHIKAHAKHKVSNEDNKYEESCKGELPFCCTMCDYRCVRPSRLALHMKTHGPDRNFLCKSCDFSTKDLGLFTSHTKEHTGYKQFTCFLCLMHFSRQENLKMHMLTHTQNKQFSCNICEYTSSNKSRLLLHLKTHAKMKPQVFFPCPLCPNKYCSSLSLRNHLKTHNTDGKPYECDFCEYSCFTSELLRVHVENLHSRVTSKYRCNVCSYTCASNNLLKAHFSIHEIEKKLQCNICQMKCASNIQLSKHMAIHKEPHISCQLCGASFSDASAKNLHMLQVHDVPKDEVQVEELQEVSEKTEEETPHDKYGYLEDGLFEDSDSDEEDVHEGQHQLIGYPEMKIE